MSQDQKELKLVVFWSLDSLQSHSLLEQIETIQAEFRTRRIKVIAVCEIQGKESLTRLQAKAIENQSIQFLHLKAGNRASSQFKGRFPVPRHPYLLMLSADNKVAGINVDPVFFEPVGR